MPQRRNVELDRKLIEGWPAAGGVQAVAAKRLHVSPSVVSRAIKRLRREGAWPHPAPGAAPARGGRRPGAGRPMTPPAPRPAPAAAELAGLHGTLTVRLPGALFHRLKRFAYERRVPQAQAVARALAAYLDAQGG